MQKRYLYCPIHGFWRFGRGDEDLDRIHSLYLRVYPRVSPQGRRKSAIFSIKRRAKAFLLSSLWPFLCAASSARYLLRYGSTIRKRTGKGLIRQFVEQLHLGVWQSIPPYSYYEYALYHQENRRRASSYIHAYERSYLARMFMSVEDRRILDDKSLFQDFCERLRISTPPVLARFESGRMTVVDKGLENGLPAVDLFSKPVGAALGRGVARWEVMANGEYSDAEGAAFSAEQLIEHLERLSLQEPYLLQPRLRNHPNLDAVSLGGLCTARIITCRLPGEDPTMVLAVLRMPRGQAAADNFAYGGIACSIDIDRGELLGSALGADPLSERFDCHPDTKRPISGIVLPQWDAAVPLCLRAHEQLASCPAIGWDVGFTPDGPMLIEGNLPFCKSLAQVPGATPLLETSYKSAILGFLEQSDEFK